MIEEILQNRKHVLEYDTNANISKESINLLLEKTWKLTPSKNNMMPYNVFVIGPEHYHYKESIYQICARNEEEINLKNPIQGHKLNPNYMNILDCSYVLLFSLRVEDKLSTFQQKQINEGIYYEATSEEGIKSIFDLISLEVGLFANTFSGLCLEQNIDTSYTMCFTKNLNYWKELPFVKREPVLLMTVGKGKVYRQDIAKRDGWAKYDLKPDYERIIKFVE